MEKERQFIAPEEGDLNTEAIKRGLSPDEEANLRKDLRAVESGHRSSDAPSDFDESSTQKFLREQEYYERDQEDERDKYDFMLMDFEKFIRSKGITEQEIRYEDIDDYFANGDSERPLDNDGGNDEYIRITRRLIDLEKEWREKK